MWVTVGDLEPDRSDNIALMSGRSIELRATERHILGDLMRHKGLIVPESEISDHIDDLDRSRHPKGVQVHIGRLRRKPGCDIIETLGGVGWRLE